MSQSTPSPAPQAAIRFAAVSSIVESHGVALRLPYRLAAFNVPAKRPARHAGIAYSRETGRGVQMHGIGRGRVSNQKGEEGGRGLMGNGFARSLAGSRFVGFLDRGYGSCRGDVAAS